MRRWARFWNLLDEQEFIEAAGNTRRAANPHEEWAELPPTVHLTQPEPTGTRGLHPLLSKLNIAPTHKAAIEDLSDSIITTQSSPRNPYSIGLTGWKEAEAQEVPPEASALSEYVDDLETTFRSTLEYLGRRPGILVAIGGFFATFSYAVTLRMLGLTPKSKKNATRSRVRPVRKRAD